MKRVRLTAAVLDGLISGLVIATAVIHVDAGATEDALQWAIQQKARRQARAVARPRGKRIT